LALDTGHGGLPWSQAAYNPDDGEHLPCGGSCVKMGHDLEETEEKESNERRVSCEPTGRPREYLHCRAKTGDSASSKTVEAPEQVHNRRSRGNAEELKRRPEEKTLAKRQD